MREIRLSGSGEGALLSRPYLINRAFRVDLANFLRAENEAWASSIVAVIAGVLLDSA